MIKFVIIDDEPPIRKGIVQKLNRLFPGKVVILAECGSLAEAEVVLRSTEPDIVLLDIQLSDGLSLALFEQNSSFDFNLIFITAYNQYAIKAIKLGALDYLLKPIEDEELKVAINRALLQQKSVIPQRESIEIIEKGYQREHIDKIILKTSSEYHIAPLKDIIYCSSDGGYTTFLLRNGSKIMVSKPLKEFQEILPEEKFLRPHQSYLINVAEVIKYEKEGFLVLNGDYRIPVSTRKKESVLKRLF